MSSNNLEEKEHAFSKIIWPENITNNDKELVTLLCKLGTVREWISKSKNENAGYDSMPYIYEIIGQIVLFLPSWSFLEIRSNNDCFYFKKPSTEDGILEKIEAVKQLEQAGLKSCSNLLK